MSVAESISTSEAPKPPARLMIEGAVRSLLPHAASNFWLPFDTPLRWHESRMQGAHNPFSFDLWANLDAERQRTLSIARNMQRSPTEAIWQCSLKEPIPPGDEAGDLSITSMNVYDKGRVAVERVRFKTSPDLPYDYGVCVGGEWDFMLSDERREELLVHMGGVISDATVRLPTRQREYFRGAGEGALSSRSFARLGSQASKTVLNPLLVA